MDKLHHPPVRVAGSLLARQPAPPPVAKPDPLAAELATVKSQLAQVLKRLESLEMAHAPAIPPEVNVAAPHVEIQTKKEWVHVHEYDHRGDLVKTTSTATD